MKLFLTAFSLIFLLSSCHNSAKNYSEEIKNFQYNLNLFYNNPEESPLTKKELKTFKTLEFFEINKKYEVEATLELTPNAPIFEMKTTTDRLPLYKKYAIAKFSIDEKVLELSIYQSQHLETSIEFDNHLFLPFNDLTNGTLSYGGGRYIDIEIPAKNSKTITIDFNKAYNPYCTYNYKYSCPIPPVENNLKIEIKAGVKSYKKHL